MRVLITGAGGFIGSHLVVDQLERGREVTAVDLHVEALQPLSSNSHLQVVAGDFTDTALLDSHLPGHDVCFHLASAHLETNVDDTYFWQVNVEGTRNFVARCHQAGIGRFVHCSSVGVYGDIESPPADEETECHPDIAYERSKLAGETAVLDYARQNDYELTVVRPAWVYGPRCPRTLKLFRTIKKGRFFFVGNGRTLRHPIYIDDMVRGFEVAATHERAAGQIFIIAGPRAVTLVELTDGIADCLGVPPPKLKLPQLLVWPGVYFLELVGALTGREVPFTRRSLKFFTGNTAFTTKKAYEVLGFRAQTELSAGLKQTRDWMRQNHET
jgi:nucleoside-diphosphate-sugar epimerase